MLKTKLLKIILIILIAGVLLGLKIGIKLKQNNATMKQREIEYLNQIHKANDTIRSLEETITKERTAFHYNIAIAYTNNKLYDEAIREYEELLTLAPNDPNNYNVYYNMAIIYDEFLDNPTMPKR